MTLVADKLKGLRNRLTRREAPLPFPDTLNIESSYHCNLRCVMCPRTFEESLQGMFPMDLFKERVVPVLPRFKYIHLTGWGEPLMNKSLVEMLKLCKDAGCWVCFTSNGLLLKDPLSRRVIETGVDMINISCDASDPKTYEMVRGKGTFDVLQQRMQHMAALRKEMNSPIRLEWAFVMMKTNLHEMSEAARLAAKYGFDRFHAKHMETAVNRIDMGNALWNTRIVDAPGAEWDAKLEAALADLRKAGEETGLDIVIHPRHFVRDGQCLARPANQIFIDYKGYISSCCYLNKLDVKPYMTKEERPAEDGVMGDLNLAQFVEILDSPAYQQFRREWLRGEVPKSCHGCVNLNRMDAGA